MFVHMENVSICERSYWKKSTNHLKRNQIFMMKYLPVHHVISSKALKLIQTIGIYNQSLWIWSKFAASVSEF